MVVFKRFPKLHPLPKEEKHLVPPNERRKYPSFDADFVTLDEILMPAFRELDNEALLQQSRYRWAYIILIFGGSLATIFGIVQIAFQNIDWPGIVEAVIATILVITTTASRSFNNQELYLDKRLAAEQLRSTYFLFLGHYPPYEDEPIRAEHLRRQVEVIKRRARH
ncbi:MAG: hypothetical protein NVS4B12_06600 [Ktedonobacteraceae bacterium]